MMKKALRVLIVTVLVLITSTMAVFATTDTAAAATKKAIPGTSAKADSRVVDSLVELGFTVKYDKKMSYAGLFSVSKRAIIMKSNRKDHVLHEMGHFVARLQEASDETAEFVEIYKAEKRKYKGEQKAYVTKNSKEYFAQSFMEYTQNPSKLKKSRPRTYNFVKEQVETIEQQHVDNMYALYGWAW